MQLMNRLGKVDVMFFLDCDQVYSGLVPVIHSVMLSDWVDGHMCWILVNLIQRADFLDVVYVPNVVYCQFKKLDGCPFSSRVFPAQNWFLYPVSITEFIQGKDFRPAALTDEK